ncbi:MAG: DMT family transporter [Devosiaceae bacterium]|nr:DMT family transporter [Devosiaceae bacterium MH13]
MLLRLAPVLFVLIWSTGWIAARAAAPLADPLMFLALRFLLAGVLLLGLMAALGVPLPKGRTVWLHGLASGVLLHAIYLGGVWISIDEGLATPIAGLVAALQPLLTAVLAVSLLSEKLTTTQWLGLGLGLGGLIIALAPGLLNLEGEALAGTGWLIGLNVIAIVSVTLGTLYQKRYLPEGDLRGISLMQYIGAMLAIVPVMLATGSTHIEMSIQSALVMAWSVFGLSFAAIGLYLLLICHGAVSRAASLIYLIPPLVAIEAFFLFGEGLPIISIAGMAVTVFGVYLVNRKQSAPA